MNGARGQQSKATSSLRSYWRLLADSASRSSSRCIRMMGSGRRCSGAAEAGAARFFTVGGEWVWFVVGVTVKLLRQDASVGKCCLYFCYLIALSVCGCSATKKAPVAEVSFSTIQENMADSEANVELYIGGAVSRRLKQDRKYRPLHLFLVPRTNIVLRDVRTSHLIISTDSPEGRAVMAILEEEKPWTWKGLPAEPFSNHLSLI